MARDLIYKIFTGQELYNFLFDKKADDPWHKFCETKSRLKYFVSDDIVPNYYVPKDQEHYFFCAIEEKENKIVGILKFKTGGNDSIFYPGYKNWISSCSVDKDYQGEGISVRLVDMLFSFAKENNLNVLTSGYSELGFKRLKNVFKRYADIYEVDFKDDKDKPEFD